MVTTSLSPVAVQEFFVNGVPAVGGLLFFYAAGTTTKIVTYTDSSGATPQSNPVVLNSRGEPQGSGGQSLGLWLPANTAYKIVYSPVGDTDPPTHAIYTVDNLNSGSGGGGGGGAAGQQVYATLTAAIAATIPAGTTMVTTLGYASIGDIGGGNYLPASAGAGPGKFQSADGAWYKLSAAKPNVKQFGAKGDGSTNDQPAFANALTFWGSTGGIITVPDGTYALSSGITIPDFTYLQGDVWFPNLEAIKGVQLLFANGVATCVQLGTGSTNNPSGIENITINRTGTPPSGSIGLLVLDGQSPVVHNVGSVNHAICIEWEASLTGGTGITCHAIGIYTAAATDAHIVVNLWPELFITQCRTGCNGGVDVNCNTHLRITGGGTGGDGPNTIQFAQWQANQGQNNAQYWIDVSNVAHTDANAVEFRFTQVHAEGMTVAGIHTDSTCQFLNRLTISDIEFNCTGIPFWALNAATTMSDVFISNSSIFSSTFNIATNAPNVLEIVNSFLGNSATLTVPSGSTWGVTNCVAGALTVAGPGNMTFSSCSVISSFTNNSTGRVLCTASNFRSTQSFTPNIQFGGANVGVTYSVQDGESEWITEDLCRVSIAILLTSKGSSTGNLTVSNLPVTGDGTWGQSGGGAPTLYTGFTGLTGALVMSASSASTVLNLYQTGATGTSAVTNAAATNTMAINGTLFVRAV